MNGRPRDASCHAVAIAHTSQVSGGLAPNRLLATCPWRGAPYVGWDMTTPFAAPHPAPSPAAPARSHIEVTAADYQRLRSLVDTWPDSRDLDAVEALTDELERAEVVPAERIAGNVVTMNSHVVFEDQQTAERREVWLVYPQESDVGRGRISVLAPIGTALLGLAVGQTIEWPLPGGQTKLLRIVEVVYQPEKAGDFHL
jgi:regulator of nucleoside diphosphate kinase